jgi:hypothetical protein
MSLKSRLSQTKCLSKPEPDPRFVGKLRSSTPLKYAANHEWHGARENTLGSRPTEETRGLHPLAKFPVFYSMTCNDSPGSILAL